MIFLIGSRNNLHMKTLVTMMIAFFSVAGFAQEHETSKGKGTDKHTPANKDYDKPVSKKDGAKIQVRKSGDNTNGLADTARQLKVAEENTVDRSEDFSASSSGSPSVKSENGGLLPDGTNTAQRASYNVAGSPVPVRKKAAVNTEQTPAPKAKPGSEKNGKKRKR
jgi:hypothetical protein